MAGRRVLVVEDEPFIALSIEEMIGDIGGACVGVASTVREALAALVSLSPNFVVLDISLGDERSHQVADQLAERAIPFVFISGYGAAGIPAQHKSHACVAKPFGEWDFAEAIAAELKTDLAKPVAAEPNASKPTAS